MKKTIFALAMVAFLISCESGNNEKAVTSDSTVVTQDTAVTVDNSSSAPVDTTAPSRGGGGSTGENRAENPIK